MFGRGITLFKLFGFAIRLDLSWLIIATLVVWTLARGYFPAFVSGLAPATYWWMAALGAIGLFLSIILHECGHSLVARAYGIPMQGITLFVFGGVAEMGGEPPNPKSEFLMAIAGPLTSFAIAAVSFGLRSLTDAVAGPVELTAIFAYLTWINLMLGAFNLVPAFPLDGGRVLRSVLWAGTGRLRRATRIASAVGSGFGYLLIAWGIIRFFFGNFIGGVWWVLIGLFIRGASQMSYRQVVVSKALAGEPVARIMNTQPVTVPASISLKEFVDRYVYRFQFRLFPVVDNGRLLGCLDLDKVKKIPRDQWDTLTAQNTTVPCSDDNTVRPDTEAVQVLSKMRGASVNQLMVVDEDRLVGVVALKDLLNFLSRKMEFEGA